MLQETSEKGKEQSICCKDMSIRYGPISQNWQETQEEKEKET